MSLGSTRLPHNWLPALIVFVASLGSPLFSLFCWGPNPSQETRIYHDLADTTDFDSCAHAVPQEHSHLPLDFTGFESRSKNMVISRTAICATHEHGNLSLILQHVRLSKAERAARFADVTGFARMWHVV